MNSILLLHGALGCAAQLENLKSTLLDKGYQVCDLNFSGHGGMPFQEDFRIEQFAEDVIHFFNDYQIQKIDIFGYSMGGYVAMWLCYRYPDLIGYVVTLGTKFDWSPESAKKEIAKMDPEKIIVKIPAFARLLEHRHAPNDWKLLMKRTADMMKKLGDAPLLNETEFKSIQSKVTIALGDMDDMADRSYSRAVATWLPQGKFVLLENTPHPIEKVNLTKLVDLIGDENR